MTTAHVAAAIVVLCGTALIGCGKNEYSEPRMQPASGLEPAAASGRPNAAYAPGAQMSTTRPIKLQTREQTTQELIEARCRHENSCGRIGPGNRFSTWKACLDVEGESVRTHMLGCFLGTPKAALDACEGAIRLQDCNAMPDTLSMLRTCDVEQLCSG